MTTTTHRARRARRPLQAVLIAGALAFTPLLQATGAERKDSGAPRPPAKVTFVEAPSHETPAARTKRLKRECKGRPNAGMCLGHTR
ncbi:MAG: hypothetical protein KGZ67_09365 [Hydrogenophaga sp.]|jgi:hypothetical protein|nr:hypothetical protein [Hydrogenophaga sp.]